MFKSIPLFATLVLLSFTSAAPLILPVGDTGVSLSINEDGVVASLDGQTIDLGTALNKVVGASTSEDAERGNQNQASAANGNPKAVYFISNAAKNSIVALKVASNGLLSDGSITATGGLGAVGVDAMGKPVAVDPLFSQGAIKVEGNAMVAVNPGSNTISMFLIDHQDPTKLRMVGKPADTLGEFPVSVTISSKLSMACVANSGAKAGIACFSMSKAGLKPLDKTLRPFELNQSTPPVGPTNTVSQTFFNADSTALLTTVKGDPMKNNTGFLSSFPVEDGCVSMTGTRSSPNGTAVLFGSTTLPGTNDIFVTDASFGAATLSLTSKNIGAIKASTKIEGQVATCWATFSSATKTAFVTDVGTNILNEIDVSTGALVKGLDANNGNMGMIDLQAKGNFIYALAPGNMSKVAVFDVSGGQGSVKAVQNFQPKGMGMGIGGSAQGIALL
ncbi:hypothetical protein BJ875DRAFT_272675 [Amylocarpus encephaloides]|uniref:3-carboxymuconate cyclase n=1 Tax=Amylocarpus encephaloides TaxID=45428 RepID=A0A9P8BZF4_9HELO|nr:hypothetical protein BJ875DRAFT_272675 [Amylocarpus encephaloides]